MPALCAKTVSGDILKEATSLVEKGFGGDKRTGRYAFFVSFLSHAEEETLDQLNAGAMTFEMSLLPGTISFRSPTKKAAK